MDKIKKFLEKLSQKEKETTKEILSLLETNNVSGLDVKKLKGYENIFRVRKGKLRIIFSYNKNLNELYLEKIVFDHNY